MALNTAPRWRHCPYCSGASLRHCYNAEFEGWQTAYDRCGECGSIIQNPPLSKESLAAFYDSSLYWGTTGKAEYLYIGYLKQEQAYIREGMRRYRLICQSMRRASLEGLTVLKIGCGAGFSALPFLKEGAKVKGIEPSAEMAAFARKQYGMDVIQGMFEDVPFQANSFDVIYSWGTSMNFRDPGAVYEKAQRLLKPGGYLFVDFFDMGSPFAFLTRRKRRKGVHISCAPSKQGMQSILHHAGFSQVTFSRFFPFFSFLFIVIQLDLPLVKQYLNDSALGRMGIPIPLGGFYIVQSRKPIS